VLIGSLTPLLHCCAAVAENTSRMIDAGALQMAGKALRMFDGNTAVPGSDYHGVTPLLIDYLCT